MTAKMWVSSLLKKIYLFIWLHMVWVSVVGHQLSCLMAEASSMVAQMVKNPPAIQEIRV